MIMFLLSWLDNYFGCIILATSLDKLLFAQIDHSVKLFR